MIDPDLQKQFDLVNENLFAIRAKKSPGIWRAFFNGMFSALGYVFGLAVVLAIVGWILQQTGLWKPIQNQIKAFGNLMQSAEKFMAPANQSQPQSNSGGENSTLVTLPNGQQIRVNLPAGYNTNQ